jgi:site-specific DNA-methyltransferase (adenine-specific)
MMFNRSLFSSASGEWETPQELFDALDEEFHFTLDACATPLNTKCLRFYSAESLLQPWHGRVWVNCPYGRTIGQWTNKARVEFALGNAELVVMLLPARTDTRWFHEDVMKADEVRFIRGRLKFGGAKTGAPFPSCIAVFRRVSREATEGEGEG